MLLMVTGASGAGKSAVLAELSGRDFGHAVECAEFDSIGVPEGADTAWRHSAVERWVARAVDLQSSGAHLLLCGQVPLGELLAAPSAERLDGLEVCLLHCSPEVRRDRLRRRGEPEDALIHHVRFGEWFLRHTLDPSHSPEVIRVPSPTPMRWDRWEGWTADDPRWAAHVIDTDPLTATEAAEQVAAWARRALERAAA
ncbi:hypothetical protein FB391_3263 [Microbacterium kyungheense]|uniref:AAA domain-containing protein n=2 Tax=Microbacterium kyungheense TaxID=1263636 RepID=A0A543EF50_9MICO|nr:AAA family ATPase [Microbacterium kyungheense]TQM20129.1 hypothetical protein FB391_3263 [Microbacterium kyungheense]